MKRRTRRWGRILFNTLTAISLLLAIATAGLWVRSGFALDQIARRWREQGVERFYWVHSQNGEFGFGSTGGMLVLGDTRIEAPKIEYDTRPTQKERLTDRIFPDWRSWEASCREGRFGEFSWIELRITVSYWLLLSLLLVFPSASAIQRHRRRNSEQIGLCPACGYDIRANPAKCSECGHEFTTHP